MNSHYNVRIRKIKKLGNGTYVSESYSPGYYLIVTIFCSIFKAIWLLIYSLFRLCRFIVMRLYLLIRTVCIYIFDIIQMNKERKLINSINHEKSKISNSENINKTG